MMGILERNRWLHQTASGIHHNRWLQQKARVECRVSDFAQSVNRQRLHQSKTVTNKRQICENISMNGITLPVFVTTSL
jgi:hypothetical protein